VHSRPNHHPKLEACEWIESKQLRLEYCQTDDMLADLFTKPLNSAKHKVLTERILGTATAAPKSSAAA
jgi:hypothetical protein